MRKRLIPFAAASLTAACFLMPPAGAIAAPSFAFEATGSNKLNIGDFTVATYAVGLTISPTGVATRSVQTYRFPIAGGTVDSATIVLESLSTGGMVITKGTTLIELDSPIVNTIGTQPVMSFMVTINGTLQGRLDMFDLQVPDYAKPQTLVVGQAFKAIDIAVTLSQAGANLLNTNLSNSFNPGLSVGTLKVRGVLGEQLPQ